MKIIRKSFFWWAILSMTLSSVGGCASSGQRAGSTAYDPSEFPLEPTAESLVRLPEGSDVAVELVSGERVTGVFLKLSAGATALDLSVNEESDFLAPEFLEDDLLYRIPLDSIKTIAAVEIDSGSKSIGVLGVLGIVVIAFFTAAALGAFHIDD